MASFNGFFGIFYRFVLLSRIIWQIDGQNSTKLLSVSQVSYSKTAGILLCWFSKVLSMERVQRLVIPGYCNCEVLVPFWGGFLSNYTPVSALYSLMHF
jgi:hypothetical protein